MPTINRRQFLASASGFFAGVAAAASTPAKVHRIGILTSLGTFEQSDIPVLLKKLGYEEGRNCVYEFRSSNRQRDLLPGLAAELVAAKVDVIVALLPPEILAAKNATSTIPIVMVYGLVPVEMGLVRSLARPGGNVTGTLLQGPEWAGKHCQIARDLFGRGARLVALYDPGFPGLELYIEQMHEVAKRVGLRIDSWRIQKDDDVRVAIARLGNERPAAFSFSPTGPLLRQVKPLMAFAEEQRIPGISTTKWPVEKLGALFAYEPDVDVVKSRTMAIVDKVLKGTAPNLIPVEQPTHYELWINLKTAQHCGVKIPESVLVQTTRLIN